MAEWAKGLAPEEYCRECESRRERCLREGHDWRSLGPSEAYPALGGRTCRHCDLVELRW